MANLERNLQKALGKKGAITKKQVQAEESILAQNKDILKLREKLLDAEGKIKTLLQKRLQAARVYVAKDRLDYTQIMKQVRESTSAVKKAQKDVKTAEREKAKEEAKKLKEEQKAQKERQRWEQKKRGTYKETTRYDANGIAQTSFRVSKAISNSKHMNRPAAEAAVRAEIARMRKTKNIAPGSEQYSLRRGGDGTWSYDLSAQGKQPPTPGNSLGSRIFEGVKQGVSSVLEVIGKLVAGFRKLLGGVTKAAKSLYNFAKKAIKFALGIPILTALFSKLASLNGLNRFEFIGNKSGSKGNATTARTMERLEDMYGTDGSMANLAGNQFNLLNDPYKKKIFMNAGFTPEQIKGLGKLDPNQFAFTVTKQIMSQVSKMSGLSLDYIHANPTDSRVVAAGQAYLGRGFGEIMGLDSLLAYNKNGRIGSMQSDLKDPYVSRLIKPRSEQEERNYKKTLYAWQDLWIDLATKISPHMNEISRGLNELAGGFIDLLFKSGGFRYLVDLFMNGFRKLKAWLESDDVKKRIGGIIDTIADYAKKAVNWLTTKDKLTGKTGFDKIMESIQKTYDVLVEVWTWIQKALAWLNKWFGPEQISNAEAIDKKSGTIYYTNQDVSRTKIPDIDLLNVMEAIEKQEQKQKQEQKENNITIKLEVTDKTNGGVGVGATVQNLSNSQTQINKN